VKDKHDPDCFLCPGNKRVGGHENPKYDSTFVFQNDFSALLAEEPAQASSSSDLFQSSPVQGKCQVICFHPRHDLTLALMENEEISAVIDGWKGAYEEEGAKMSGEGYIQIFEVCFESPTRLTTEPWSNDGRFSSPPSRTDLVYDLVSSGRDIADRSVPDEPAVEMTNMAQYSKTHQCCEGPQGLDGRPHLLLDYATQEVSRKDRVVELDESGWIAVVPFWAVWPFEIMSKCLEVLS
jgi:UDPglucose--hexose-1-phosphate uridylyltransferase